VVPAALLCSLPTGFLDGPYSARYQCSSIGDETPTCACGWGG
jgi:hypothetical protein